MLNAVIPLTGIRIPFCSFDTSTENATLTIENVRNDDAKTYLCNVTNEYGSDARELELIIIGTLCSSHTCVSVPSIEIIPTCTLVVNLNSQLW